MNNQAETALRGGHAEPVQSGKDDYPASDEASQESGVLVMSILLLPFKILGGIGSALGSGIGSFIMAIVAAILFRQGACWCAWNFGWTWMTTGWLAGITIGSFVLTLYCGVSKK